MVTCRKIAALTLIIAGNALVTLSFAHAQVPGRPIVAPGRPTVPPGRPTAPVPPGGIWGLPDSIRMKMEATGKGQKATQDLIKTLENNAAYEMHISNSGTASVTEKTLAYESRVLEDLRAELAFWNAASDISTTFGTAGLAAFGVAAARELEKTGIPMARAAGVVALVTAAIAQGGTQYISANKSGLEKKIKDLKASIESQENWLMWQEDYGGQGSPAPVAVKCLIKETCRDSDICVHNGTGPQDCEVVPTCVSEILTCREDL